MAARIVLASAGKGLNLSGKCRKNGLARPARGLTPARCNMGHWMTRLRPLASASISLPVFSARQIMIAPDSKKVTSPSPRSAMARMRPLGLTVRKSFSFRRFFSSPIAGSAWQGPGSSSIIDACQPLALAGAETGQGAHPHGRVQIYWRAACYFPAQRTRGVREAGHGCDAPFPASPCRIILQRT